MNAIPQSLLAIESALERLERTALLRALRPGLTSDQVRSSLGSIGLTSHAELEQLYGWHDGTSTTGGPTLDDIHLLPGFYLLSLEDATANYRVFVTDARWSEGWLPILANGGGDFYVVELGEAEYHPVRHFRIEAAEHPVEFVSLTDMLNTVEKAFERGVFFVDSSGYLEMNDLSFGSLAAELNPDVGWWSAEDGAADRN